MQRAGIKARSSKAFSPCSSASRGASQGYPGCLEAAVAPLYVPEMSAADQEAFGASAGGFAEMARG